MFVVVDKDDKTLVASALQLGYELKKLQRDEWQLSHEYYFTIHQHNCTTYRINPVQVKPWQWSHEYFWHNKIEESEPTI